MISAQVLRGAADEALHVLRSDVSNDAAKKAQVERLLAAPVSDEQFRGFLDLSGRVAVQFVIGTTGKVSNSVVASDTTKDKQVSRCIAKAVKRWKFPKPRGGGQVIVTYPFNLSPG